MCNKDILTADIYSKALYYLRQEDINTSKRYLKKIVDENDIYFKDACYLLSKIYFYLEKYVKSQDYIIKCMYTCDIDDDDVLLLYAHTLAKVGDHHGALYLYNNVAKKEGKIYQIMYACMYPQFETQLRRDGLQELLQILLKDTRSDVHKFIYTLYTGIYYHQKGSKALSLKWTELAKNILDDIEECSLNDEIEFLIHFGTKFDTVSDMIKILRINNNICC